MKELIYNNLQKWIPPTDVDGVDLKPEIASTARNIIFQNGFFKNAVNTIDKVLPSNVQALVDLGLTIEGYTNFTHSTQGFHEVYVLWQNSSKKLYIYIDNTVVSPTDSFIYTVCDEKPYNVNFSLVNDQLKINLNCTATILGKQTVLNLTLLYLNEVVYLPGLTEFSAVTFYPAGAGTNTVVPSGTETNGLDKHYEIEISEFAGTPDGDFYKATYKVDGVSAGEDLWITADGISFTLWTGIVITFPLMAGYILGDVWTFLTTTSNLVRPEGWHLTTRWLGDKLVDDRISVYNAYPVNGIETESFEDVLGVGGWAITTNPFPTPIDLAWSVGASGMGVPNGMYITRGSDQGQGHIYYNSRLANVRNLNKIKLKYWSRGSNFLTWGYFTIKINDRVIFTADALTLADGNFKEVEIEVSEFNGTKANLDIMADLPFGDSEDGQYRKAAIVIFSIEFIPSETMLIAKYSDSQRAFLTTGHYLNEDFGMSVFGGSEKLQIRLGLEYVDWRIDSYELYAKNVNDLYILKGKVSINSNKWELISNILRGEITLEDEEEAVQTVNFNYGLGQGVRVDTQHLIFNEASFNNRVYAVNGGYRILQTHIAGNGRIQPDSFPYDEDDYLGFIEEAKSSSLQSLFIINNNFLMLFMKNGFSLYMINTSPYRGVLQKELRMLSSSFTGFNSNSLTRTINATSSTIGAYWVTNEGIWFHDGSLGSVPINLISETHKNYWRTVEKTNFGFYDYQDNEYWYATKVFNQDRDDPSHGGGREFTEFLVYEINYKSFRFVRLEKAYYGLAGYIDGKPLLRTDSKIGTLDKGNNKSLAGLVETHWNDLGNDYYNKIAQSLHLQLKDSYADGTIVIKAQFDNQSLVYSFTVSTNEKLIVRLFPESVRFNSVKLSVLLSNTDQTEIAISSFKMLYTEDGIGRFAEFLDHQIIIEGGGYGRAYGRYYGGSLPEGTGTGYGTQFGKHYGN